MEPWGGGNARPGYPPYPGAPLERRAVPRDGVALAAQLHAEQMRPHDAGYGRSPPPNLVQAGNFQKCMDLERPQRLEQEGNSNMISH